MPVPNPNHHLWRNGRLWWVAFTVVYDGWRQERIRRSLETADLDEARRRRDGLLQQYALIPSADVAALRGMPTRESVAFDVRADRVTSDAFSIARPAFGIDPEPSHA